VFKKRICDIFKTTSFVKVTTSIKSKVIPFFEHYGLISFLSFYLLFSEIDKYDTGLLIEVWDKGMLWDKAIGFFWAPLHFLQFTRLVSRKKTIINKKAFFTQPFYSNSVCFVEQVRT
jgi:hypothetical protein